MSAVVIDFATAAAKRAPRAPEALAVQPTPPPAPALSHDFTFWRGASGSRYVHTVYPLLECPEVPNTNVVLVRRLGVGQPEVLHVGRVEQDAPSLNLAEIRRTAALLGANEVHVHLLARTTAERRFIEHDLCGAGLAGGRAAG